MHFYLIRLVLVRKIYFKSDFKVHLLFIYRKQRLYAGIKEYISFFKILVEFYVYNLFNFKFGLLYTRFFFSLWTKAAKLDFCF